MAVQQSRERRKGHARRKDLPTLDEELQDFSSNQPLLYSWLLKRGYYGSKKNPSLSTHLLMDGHGGGILNVPEQALSTMYDVFALDVDKGFEIPLIENRTEWFAWHGDADIYGPRRLRDAEILDYCITVQQTIKKFYQKSENDEGPSQNHPRAFDMVILLVKFTKHKAIQANRAKEQTQTDRIKTGIHLVMPYLHVTASQCLTIRMSIIAGLYDKYGEWPGFNSIEDQIDRTVYTANGLRVPGAAKYDKCPRCKNDKNEKSNCPRCFGKGRCSIGRQYFPHKYLNSDGSLNDTQVEYLKENVARMIKKCIVGRSGPSRHHLPYREPLGAPVDPKEHNESFSAESAASGQKRPRRGPQLSEDELGIRKFSRTKKLIENAVILKKVEEVVRRAAALQFEDMLNGKPIGLRLDRLYSISTDKCYRALVRGECENWCSNLIPGEKHRGNRHYWEIRPHGLQQRCFCQCKKLERRVGSKYCMDFYGRVHGLSGDEIRLLFPEHSTVNLMLSFQSDGGRPRKHPFSACSGSAEDKKLEAQSHLHFLKKETWGDIVAISNKVYGAEKEDEQFDPTRQRKKARKGSHTY